MLFADALVALQAGEYVWRPSWATLPDYKGDYLVLLKDIPFIWKILTTPVPNAGNWLPSIADLIATDWEICPVV